MLYFECTQKCPWERSVVISQEKIFFLLCTKKRNPAPFLCKSFTKRITPFPDKNNYLILIYSRKGMNWKAIRISATDSISSFILSAVKGFIRSLDNLMRSRVLFISLCHPNANGHSSFATGPFSCFFSF